MIRLGTAALLLALSGSVHAQEACLVEALPLATRLAEAPLVVEARVTAVRSQREGGHVVSYNELEVFKVFQGQLPAGAVRLVTPGGTVGLLREEVSGMPRLAAGQQGVFLLAPDAAHPGYFRLPAAAQSLVRYNLPLATAADPFRRYTSIEQELYPALERLTGHAFRSVRTNQELQARLSRMARPAATPFIDSFSPTTVTAGTGQVLTITGTGFGASRGAGAISFSNADNGGTSFVSPLPSDYLSWSDTQIRVRVPSTTVGGSGTPGSGRLLITNATAETSQSADNLDISYALTNVEFDGLAYPVALVGRNGSGGYTLTYNAAFQANTAARSAFERALTTWRNQVGDNRSVSATTSPLNAENLDGTNLVSFDDAAELPTGVLGVAYSFYSGCVDGRTGAINWVLEETDYVFDGERNWQYGPAAPAASATDFESVALHELGHGLQLGHIIKPGAVMHYAIRSGTQNRALSAANDVAGGNAEIDFSLTAGRCDNPAYVRLAPVPLPVTLVGFGAERVAAGVRLRWQTAAEVNSAFFAVETTRDPAGEWQELTRQPAAGNSATARRYEYLDTRDGAGPRYYRLRQQDEDGTFYYSSVVMVAVARAGELVAYPNPFSAELRVALPAAAAATLRLYDLTGQLVREQVVPAGQTAAQLPAAALRPGVYVLEWRTTDGQSARTRVVKQ